MKVNKLKLNDPSYPEVLRQIPTPPKQIYFVGSGPSDWLAKPKVAVVGSRKITAYGRAITNQLVTELARAGVVIISGLALGVDGEAHGACLKAGGLTIVVLPTSLDAIYPATHNNLARQILNSGGTLISEYPPGADTYRVNFIARNRIVSGLADGLLITEATINSGTMHTARFALDQGKTVMAVPGNITSETSQGTNNLIKSGAIPVTEASDVLAALNIKPAASKQISLFKGSEAEKRIFKLIKTGMTSQEELAIKSKLDANLLNSVLTMLEINGYIKPLGGGNWSV